MRQHLHASGLICLFAMAAAAAPLPAQQPAAPAKPLAYPRVVLSDKHAANCLVKVGDPFPNLSLNDDAGQPQVLQQLRGQAGLTLVVFFRADHPVAADAFKLLHAEVVTKYGGKVAVVAVHYGPADEAAKQLFALPGRTFSVLIDAQHAALAQVAKDARLPRLYLLDAAGKVVWFDIELAEETRRQLHAALRFGLGQ